MLAAIDNTRPHLQLFRRKARPATSYIFAAPQHHDHESVIIRESNRRNLVFIDIQLVAAGANSWTVGIDEIIAGPASRRPTCWSKRLDAPSWLWSSIVGLVASHEAAYLEHCRRYALETGTA